MVDGKPDSSHTELTTFIIRYMNIEGDKYSVKKRFLVFVDFCNKTGMEIAKLILETYNGAQTQIRSINSLSIYSSCACHSLNRCGTDSAMSCMENVIFFGMV